MTRFADSSRRFRTALGVAFCASAALAVSTARSAPAEAVPDFMGAGGGWRMLNTTALDFLDPLSGPKGIDNDPNYPHVGNRMPGQKTNRVADLTNPILQDWVKPQMQKYNDEVIEGKIPFVATSLCWPGGVPSQFQVPTTVYFIQKPDEIWMIWERDHMVRHVSLNQKHSDNPKPSWFGESVGHYENGDTLVIDSIGFNEHEYGFVDNYRTPHTDQLHTTERWKLSDDGKSVDVSFTVEDDGAFTMAWGGRVHYNANPIPITEFVCAENNFDYFHIETYSMPEADKPDF